MRVSNLETNCRVRSVLVRHRIDLRKIDFGSFRGIIRIRGILYRLCCGSHIDFTPYQIEKLESELVRIRGVTKVYFDLTNWKKDSTEQWQAVEQRSQLEICEDASRDTPTVFEVKVTPKENKD